MKSKIIKILFIAIALITCVASIVSCGSENESNRKKLTEAEITEGLAEVEGTISIEGDSSDVTAFSITFKNANIQSKSIMSNIVSKGATTPQKLTFDEFKSFSSFVNAMSVDGFMSDFTEDNEGKESGEFDGDEYIEKILALICDGESITYNDTWTLSATVNKSENTLTLKAYR